MKSFCFKNKKNEEGVALIGALLMLLLISALAVGLMYKVNTEQRLQKTDSGNTQSYYGAEAGMEKMMADLDALYLRNAAPNMCDLAGLQALVPPIAEVGVTYSNYAITVPNAPGGCGAPPTVSQTVSTGPNQGLMAQIVPMNFQITATRPGAPGEEVSMIRRVEVAELPVFQFGVFSESDLSYFPGPAFDFAGRVHTNGNLFLASDNSVTFHSKVRAAGDIVRDKMANGADTNGQGRTGTILVPTTTGGCDAPAPACRNLRLSPNDGSSTGGPTPTYGGTGAANPGWQTMSSTTYNGMIMSGSSGAKKLTLPFVQAGVPAIQIIRPAPVGESLTSPIGVSRLYNKAQIRVLLVDDPAELPGGAGAVQNIRLANVASGGVDYTAGVPVGGAANKTFFAEGTTAAVSTEASWVLPAAEATLVPAGAPLTGANTWNLVDGWLRVEIRKADGTYQAVTREWIELGFARGLATPVAGTANPIHPNAILLFQQPADRDGNGALNNAVPGVAATKTQPAVPPIPAEMVTDAGTASTWTGPATRTNWYPINMYDTREGEFRDVDRSPAGAPPTTCNVGGVMNVVEIDVNNLRLWLANSVNGQLTDSVSENGYVLFFSDRRGMLPNPTPSYPVGAAAYKTGEYGFEDVINPATAAGTPNNVLDAGENVGGHGNGFVLTYGKGNLGLGFGAGNSGDPTRAVQCINIARKNFISGARHAVRLIDGSLGRVPTKPDGTGGFTLASENPAYIRGNYNTNDATFGSPHASAAVIADTVTLLSSVWSDLVSFQNPTTATNRNGATTSYRVAIATGKNINFPKPGFAGAPNDFGTDGGVHNFLRMLEDWNGATLNYTGSMASFYYSQYATGVFKCCTTVYGPPIRNYAFDLDFLDINKMPPGTPKFQDVVNVGFTQVF